MVTTAARWARRLLAAAHHDWTGLWAAVRCAWPVRSGLYTYHLRPPAGSRRIHLRIEPDGSGVLLVDVTDAIHLNSTAAWLAKLALAGTPSTRVVAVLRGRFRGMDPARLRCEAEQIYALVDHLSTTVDVCPTCGLGELARTPPFSTSVRAPYKADLTLTYGCNNACRHCYNQRRRKGMPSLSSGDWRRVLQKVSVHFDAK